MNNSKLIIGTFVVFLFFAFTNSSNAQYIIQQIEYEIPVRYQLLLQDIEFETPEDKINHIINIPLSKLKEVALSEGREIIEENSKSVCN